MSFGLDLCLLSQFMFCQTISNILKEINTSSTGQGSIFTIIMASKTTVHLLGSKLRLKFHQQRGSCISDLPNRDSQTDRYASPRDSGELFHSLKTWNREAWQRIGSHFRGQTASDGFSSLNVNYSFTCHSKSTKDIMRGKERAREAYRENIPDPSLQSHSARFSQVF